MKIEAPEQTNLQKKIQAVLSEYEGKEINQEIAENIKLDILEWIGMQLYNPSLHPNVVIKWDEKGLQEIEVRMDQ